MIRRCHENTRATDVIKSVHVCCHFNWFYIKLFPFLNVIINDEKNFKGFIGSVVTLTLTFVTHKPQWASLREWFNKFQSYNIFVILINSRSQHQIKCFAPPFLWPTSKAFLFTIIVPIMLKKAETASVFTFFFHLWCDLPMSLLPISKRMNEILERLKEHE